MKWLEKSANLVSIGSQIYYKELKNGGIHYNKDWFQQAISRTSNITETNMTSNTNAMFRYVILYRNYNEYSTTLGFPFLPFHPLLS
jgi:hypothetical protein